MKTTQLNEVHRAAGAKLVDFAGWEMPLHYGSQLEEHRTVRTDAGMFDTSHMLAIDVQGEDAREFLGYAFANNVERLKEPGKALYSCMLAEDGGVIDDLIVYFLADDFYRVIVNAGTAEGDLAWLDQLRVKKAAEVTLKSRRDLAMIAVQGPNAREKTWAALPELRAYSADIGIFFGVQVGDIFIARTGYTGEDGFELLVPGNTAAEVWARLAAAGVRPCGLGARDTLRLEAGMNLYGQDMDTKVSPLESGLAWTVDLKSPRDFVGKAALLSKPATRHSVGLVLPPKGGVLRAHQVVQTPYHDNAGDGEITSGTFSPTLNQSVALARVPIAVKPGDSVRVVIRDKAVEARVVKPPFARNGKALV